MISKAKPSRLDPLRDAGRSKTPTGGVSSGGGDCHGDVKEQTHRDPCRVHADGAVCRDLRRSVHLSDNQDGAAEPDQRAIDRAWKMGGLRQLSPPGLGPSVLAGDLEHPLFCRAFSYPEHAPWSCCRAWREPSQGLAADRKST